MFKTLKRRKKRSKNHSIKHQRGGGAMLGKSEGTPEKRLKKYAAQLKIDLKKDNNEVKEFKKQLAEWERLNALAQEEEDMEAPEKFLDWFDKTAWRAQVAEAKAATLAASAEPTTADNKRLERLTAKHGSEGAMGVIDAVDKLHVQVELADEKIAEMMNRIRKLNKKKDKKKDKKKKAAIIASNKRTIIQKKGIIRNMMVQISNLDSEDAMYKEWLKKHSKKTKSRLGAPPQSQAPPPPQNKPKKSPSPPPKTKPLPSPPPQTPDSSLPPPVPPPPELSVRTRKELGGVKKPAAKKSTAIAPTTTQQPSDKGKPAKKQIPDNCGGKLFPHLAKYCANESVTDPKCNCVPGSPANIRAMVEETEKTPTSEVKDLWLLFMGHGVTPYNPELLVK